jgi:hypothetical protein
LSKISRRQKERLEVLLEESGEVVEPKPHVELKVTVQPMIVEGPEGVPAKHILAPGLKHGLPNF